MALRVRKRVSFPFQLYLLLLSTSALAEEPTSTTEKPTQTTIEPTQSYQNNQHISSGTPFGSRLPNPSDSAPSGNHNKDSNASGLVNYYFVFLALIIAIAGVIVFLIIRRRRRLVYRRRYSQNMALSRDLGGPREGGGWSDWQPERTGGRYWQGRWQGADTSREEGLNEHGEAPPPYIPKRDPQEAHREVTEPAVPLQTLSRDGAGLKPPDYSEYRSQDTDGASSSRDTERRT